MERGNLLPSTAKSSTQGSRSGPPQTNLRSPQGPDPRILFDTALSDGEPSRLLRFGLIKYCSVRQGGADELLLRVTEEVPKRGAKIVLGSVVGDPVFAPNDPIHVVLPAFHPIPHGGARGQLSPRLQKQRWPVDIPKMQMSNVMNQSAPRTSWVIASS